MINSNRQSSVSINPRKPLISVHWDFQNIPDKKLADYIQKFANLQSFVVSCKAYDNWNQESCKAAKIFLECRGVECINVSQPTKNAVDFKLSMNCARECSSYLSPDHVILISGDCFTEILTEDLHEYNKSVTVIARQGSQAKNLESIADKFYSTQELSNLFNKHDN